MYEDILILNAYTIELYMGFIESFFFTHYTGITHNYYRLILQAGHEILVFTAEKFMFTFLQIFDMLQNVC